MQSDIVASYVTVAAGLSASVTHWHTVTLPFCRNRRNSTDGRWVQPSGLQGCNLRCFQGLVTLLPIPPCSSLWLSFFLPSLRPAYLTYFLLSSLVHDQGRKERQGWAVDQQSAYCPVVDSGFLHYSFCSFYDWTPVACIHCNYSSIQMLQVNYLREELQMLSKSNHVAIVTVDGRPG